MSSSIGELCYIAITFEFASKFLPLYKCSLLKLISNECQWPSSMCKPLRFFNGLLSLVTILHILARAPPSLADLW
jgi:hypothetical protein